MIDQSDVNVMYLWLLLEWSEDLRSGHGLFWQGHSLGSCPREHPQSTVDWSPEADTHAHSNLCGVIGQHRRLSAYERASAHPHCLIRLDSLSRDFVGARESGGMGMASMLWTSSSYFLQTEHQSY